MAPGARVDVNGGAVPDMSATYAAHVRTRFVGPAVMTVGAGLAIVASFLPWLRSGTIERSSYDLIGLVHLLHISDDAHIRLLIRLWPVMPLLVVSGVVAAWWGWRLIGAGFGVVAAAFSGIPSAAVAHAIHDRNQISVTDAPTWTAAGASVLLLGSFILLVVRVPSADAHAR